MYWSIVIIIRIKLFILLEYNPVAKILYFTSSSFLFLDITLIFDDFQGPTIKFHDFPGLEIEILKFHDHAGFPWSVRAMHLQTTRLSSLLGLGRKPVRKEYPLPPPPSLVWLTFSGLGGLSGRRDLNIAGSARRGSGIPVYPKKIRQNTPKYPKFI